MTIKETGDEYKVESKGGKHMGTYNTKKEAKKRLKQVEWFKKAIIETEFIKTYPQFRQEVENEMKFRNILQQEAEEKVARKNKIQHPNFKRGFQGRWAKMLKIAAPITSTTAGLESKPRYGKKKKDEEIKFDVEEDTCEICGREKGINSELCKRCAKNYLKKAKRVKKKRFITIKNVLINQELGISLEKIQTSYTNWKRDIEGLSKEVIGVTGRGHDKEGTTGKDNLLEYLQFHVKKEVVRPNRNPRKRAHAVVDKLDSIILDENSLIDEKDEEIIISYIARLIAMDDSENDNPRNIKFTQPKRIIEDGVHANTPKNKKLKRVGKTKYIGEGKDTVYGHYRTPMYIESRLKIDGITEKIEAVDTSWYNSSLNQAKPPFWQAIFASAKDVKSGGKGNLIDKGLLAILQEFKEGIDEAYINEIIIKDEGDLPERVNDLLKLPQLGKELMKIIKDSNSYRGQTRKLKYTGVGGILDRINDKKWKGQEKQTQKYLEKIAPYLSDIKGMDDVKEFKIYFTVATLNRLINAHVRGNKKHFLAPNGKPFELSSAGYGQKYTGQSWSSAYEAAVKRTMPKLKKSWTDVLWS